jgi:hypothetical protein
MEQATFEQRLAALLVLGFDLYALETDGATSVRITKDHCYAVGRHPSVLEALARAVTAWEKLHADEGMGLVALLNDPACGARVGVGVEFAEFARRSAGK